MVALKSYMALLPEYKQHCSILRLKNIRTFMLTNRYYVRLLWSMAKIASQDEQAELELRQSLPRSAHNIKLILYLESAVYFMSTKCLFYL